MIGKDEPARKGLTALEFGFREATPYFPSTVHVPANQISLPLA